MIPLETDESMPSGTLLGRLGATMPHNLSEARDRGRRRLLKNTRSFVFRYGTAVALVLAAVLVKLYLIKQGPSLPFIMAVMLSVWFGGLGPGILSVLLIASASGWVLTPKHSLSSTIETGLAMGFFLVATQAISKLYAGYQKTADAVLTLSRGLEDRDRKLVASEQSLQQETRIQKAMLYRIGEGEIVVNAKREFLVYNPAAKEILGVEHRGMVLQDWSKQFEFYLPDTVTTYPVQDLPMARALRGEVADNVEMFLRSDKILNGTWLSVTARPLRDERGESQGAVAVFRDISANKRAEEAKSLAKEAAEQANQAKSEFLSRMSHELRTPLNSILGFAQILDLADLPAQQKDSVGYILKGGRHLLGLINEVLDIARIEAGRLSLSPEPVRISHALQQALDLVSPLAASHGIAVHAQAAADASWFVLADQQRLSQVLLNLLSNAVKYNRHGGRVDVSCQSTNDRVRLSISDTGRGISAASLSKLFSPFERLEAEQSGIEGTGLGLALSKRLMEAMGGTIGVQSAIDKGSTFWIELQKLEDPLSALQSQTEASLAALEVQTNPGSILYIEDNLSTLRLMEQIVVNRPQIRLLAAMQGKLGLELAQAHRPNLILLDLHLPDIRGDEVLRQLKHDERTREIPGVLVD